MAEAPEGISDIEIPKNWTSCEITHSQGWTSMQLLAIGIDLKCSVEKKGNILTIRHLEDENGVQIEESENFLRILENLKLSYPEIEIHFS